MIKSVKTFFMLLGILFCVALLFLAYHLYKGIVSGNLKSYFLKFAIEAVVDESRLSPTQAEYLKEGDLEGFAKDIEQNITKEQVDCAVSAVGQERATEIMTDKNPSPSEILKLSECL